MICLGIGLVFGTYLTYILHCSGEGVCIKYPFFTIIATWVVGLSATAPLMMIMALMKGDRKFINSIGSYVGGFWTGFITPLIMYAAFTPITPKEVVYDLVEYTSAITIALLIVVLAYYLFIKIRREIDNKPALKM